MIHPTLAQQLGAFAAGPVPAAAPQAVRRSVARRVLDVLGVQLAAMELDSSILASEWVRARGGAAEALAPGLAARVPAADAAFLGGVLAHSLDFDDTHLPSVLHPSATVVPAALAVGQRQGSSGAEVVAAIAAGIETCVRVGMAGYDRESRRNTWFERGQHATSICGALGAAVAAARLLGLDDRGVVHAIGIAVSFASGVIEGNRTGGTVKRVHCGWAAHGGVAAAELAGRGLTGPPTSLEGRFGLFEAFLAGRYDADAVTAGLGERWELPGILFKPYPANHFTHAAVDAALALRARGLRGEDVAECHVGVATPTLRTIGEPLAMKQAPTTAYEAQFSGPYVMAAALLGGSGLGLGLDDFSDELAYDPERRALAARISIGSDPRCDAIFPDALPAIVTVRTRDGRHLEEAVMTNRGGLDRPLSDAELAEKFRDNAARSLPPRAVEALSVAALGLPSLPDLDDLFLPLAQLAPLGTVLARTADAQTTGG